MPILNLQSEVLVLEKVPGTISVGSGSKAAQMFRLKPIKLSMFLTDYFLLFIALP